MPLPDTNMGAGNLNSPPPQPPSGANPPQAASMAAVAPSAASLSANTFPQEVMSTVGLLKETITHLVALLPPLAPFAAQMLDQLMTMTQGIVQQSVAGPPALGGGEQSPTGMMMPPQGAGTPPPMMMG